MLLTEEEARTQICPHIRYCVNEHGVIQDRDPPIYVHQLCQASDCKMAWRRAYDATGCKRDQAGNPLGYCGLAGRPE